MIFLLAMVVGFAFGAADQYLGTIHITRVAGTWTITPAEGVALANAPQAAVNVVGANLVPANPVIPAGIVTGPLFGLLGQRWRVQRSWTGPVLVAGAFLLEPFAHEVRGNLLGPSW